MQTVINSIIDHIRREVPELRHVSRNWNQLSYEQPPVKFPCALVDTDNINFTEIKHGQQTAIAALSITVANSVMHRDNPRDTDNFLSLVQAVADAVSLFAPADAQPLIVSSVSKAYSDRSYDVYTIAATTAWTHKHRLSTANSPTPILTVTE